MDQFKDRVKALRTRLGFTQEKLAERADLERVEVVAVEGGKNQGNSTRILKGLARGFGLSLQDAMDFVDGALTVEEALRRCGTAEQRAPRDPFPARLAAAEWAREDGVQETAIRSVLEEAVRPEDAARSRLWWAMRMRMRETDMLMRDDAAPDDVRRAAGQRRP